MDRGYIGSWDLAFCFGRRQRRFFVGWFMVSGFGVSGPFNNVYRVTVQASDCCLRVWRARYQHQRDWEALLPCPAFFAQEA